MQKTIVFLIVLCAICTGPLLAQTSCAGFQVIPDFDPSDTVYVDVHEKIFFHIADDRMASDYTPLVLPPGYFMYNSSTSRPLIMGEMQNPGTYEFSFIATEFRTGCKDTVQVFRTYVESPTHICEPITIRSDWNSGSEHWVGVPINMTFFVSDGEDPPFTFSSPNLRSTARLDSLGHYTDSTFQVENYNVTIVVKDRFGCTDSLSYSIFTMCVVPEPMGQQTMTSGTTGQPYNQQVSGVQFLAFPPFSNFTTFDAIPPGLTLANNGTLSGIPTVSGDFTFHTRYNGVGGCPAVTDVTVRINQSAPVQSLWITPVCAQGDTVRNWIVHNPNAFAINVDWVRRYVPFLSGAFIAQPGDNNFSVRNYGWPNTVVISWFDQNGVKRSIVQASNDDLCTPPECAHIDGITFYHQGRQRNGNPVDAFLSNSEAVNGPPDADGSPSNLKAFSLGYNGFITMKLNANVYDQPGADLKVWEYSPNDPDFGVNPEQAEVFVSTDNANWISLGKTNPTGDCHAKLDWSFDLAGKATWCRYVKVVDVTERWAWILNSSCAPTNVRAFNDVSNGFDLDAVTCANYNNSGARTMSDIAEATLVDKDDDEQYTVAYPNPARLWLTLDFARDPDFIYPESGQVEINIIDMTGKIGVGGIHYLDNEWKTQVNVESLSPGLFVAKVRANGVTKHYKFARN